MIGKNKTRWLAFLLSVATVINLLPLTIGATNKVTAAESEPSDSSTNTDTITGTDNGDGTWTGSYLSYNEESGELEQQTATATIVTGYGGIGFGETGHTLTTGWYVALDDLAYADPLKISGNVHLILADGASVYTTDASCIDLTEGNSLTIYAQSKPKYKDDGSLDTEKTTTGRLYTGNSFESGISGIGTRNDSDSLICGTLTINGGIIEAASSGNAPGIGGGWSVGKITINGGYVDVKGNGAPAIGTMGGWVSGEYLTINGGTLIADSSTHSHYAHGIGSSSSPSFPVTINGFDFIRLSGSSSAFEEVPTINDDFYFRISVGDDLDHLTDLENSDVTSSIYTEYNAIEMIPCLHILLYECNDSETHTSACKLCGKVEYDEPHEFDASSGLCACGLWKGEYLFFDSETMSYKKELTTATVLTGDETVLNGNYVAIGEVEICSSTFEMNSSLIILADGAKLRIKGPDGSPTQIHVDAVTICAQSNPLYSKGGVVDENKNRAGVMIIDGCISGYGMDILGGIVSLGGSSAQIDVHHINMFGGLLDVAGNNPSGVIDASIGVYAPSCIKARNLNETKTAAIVGWVEIDESLKVCVTGDDGCVLPDEFDSVFGSHSSVMIEPCTDETHTADTDQDTSDSHALTCKWCGSTFASHDFDKESGLCSCGLWHGIYLEYNHKTKKYDTKTATAKVLTGRETVLTEGWYVATGACSWEISKLSIYGDVRIILADNAYFSIFTNYIQILRIVLEDDREDIISSYLCIYAQSEPVLDEDGNIDPERNSSGYLRIEGSIIGENHATTTIEGGCVAISSKSTPVLSSVALSGDLTINGGKIAINLQNRQAVDGLVTINNLKYLKVTGQPLSSLPLLSETVRFADGLYVRVTDDNGYVASKDVGSVITGNAKNIEIEPCTDATHKLGIKYKDANVHKEICEWCGYAHDIAHVFDEDTGKCICNSWSGSYLEYNSETKSYDTKTTVATVITEDMTTLTEGWYVVIGEIYLYNSRLTIEGNVNIILADGSHYGAFDGIGINVSSHLHIYAQSKPVYNGIGSIDFDKDKSGVLTVYQYSDDNGYEAAISSTSRSTDDGSLTIDGGYILIVSAVDSVLLNSVTINGGYLEWNSDEGQSAVTAESFTINGGCLILNVQYIAYGINAPVTINGLDYIYICAESCAFLQNVTITKGLYVRMQDYNSRETDEYLPFEDQSSLLYSGEYIIIEPCTHDLSITCKDSDTHNESCDWCGLDQDIAHNFDEKTSICECGTWRGSYLEYNSTTKSFETKTAVATVIVGNESKLTAGWYVVVGNVLINSAQLEISGNVNIILADGSYLRVRRIHMDAGSNLRIYGQSTPIFDEYGDIDSNSKTGKISIAGDQEALKGGYNCTLTVDGGVAWITANEYIAINISSVTLNGGYLNVDGSSNHYTNTAIAANVTINGGRLFVNGSKYGINGSITINDFDHTEIMGNIRAITGGVYILDGLRVRIATLDDDGNPTYIPLKDFGSNVKWLTFEPCTDETHSLSLKCKDAATHNESCKWCGYSQDVAHDFNEETGICECGVWGGSYLEYNSTTKSFETKTALATVITEDTAKLTEGWYVVVGDVSINSARLEISGNVNIILADESYFDVNNGITINDNSHLHIYAQSEPVYDEYHDLDGSKSKCGLMSISTGNLLKAVIQPSGAYNFYDCYLTIDGGYVNVDAGPSEKGVILNGVTINGGYFCACSGPELDCIDANKFTINGGVISIIGYNHGILADVEINGLDYIYVHGDYRAFGRDVTIAEGLHVRMQSSDLEHSDEYIAYEDQADLLESDTTIIELCTSETHKMNESKTPICKDENVHTAICEWCGTTYDAVHEYDKDTGKCICGRDGISTSVIGYTLTLDGKIGVNFYMELSDEIASSATAYMHFILPDGSTLDVPVSDAKERIIDEKTYYVFSCYVAAYEMTSDIYAQIKEGELSGTLYDFTIREYAEYIISNPSDYTEGDVAFAKALLNYGAAAQTYFEVEADDLANKNLDDTDKSITELTAEDLVSFAKEPISKEGVGSFIGFNLALGSETSLRAYFELWDGVNIGDVVFTVNGVIVKAERVGDYYRIAANNIKAFDLDEDITFTAAVGDEVLTFECSAMSYCHSVLVMETCEDYPATLKTLISAIRAYQLASEIYK